MTTNRPLSVTIIAVLYLIVGIAGFVGHGYEALTARHFPADAIVIEITEFLALLCGAFMLRGQNWARWVAVAWMAFHVAHQCVSSASGACHPRCLPGPDCLDSVSPRSDAVFSQGRSNIDIGDSRYHPATRNTILPRACGAPASISCATRT